MNSLSRALINIGWVAVYLAVILIPVAVVLGRF